MKLSGSLWPKSRVSSCTRGAPSLFPRAAQRTRAPPGRWPRRPREEQRGDPSAQLRYNHRWRQAGLPKPGVCGAGPLDVPRGRGGAETAGPRPTPPPAHLRPAGGLQSRRPASEAQRATPAPSMGRSPCFRSRCVSPVSCLPRAPTPPPRLGCKVLVLSSSEALGLLCPIRVGSVLPPQARQKATPWPGQVLFLLAPSRLGPPTAPPGDHLEGNRPHSGLSTHQIPAAPAAGD